MAKRRPDAGDLKAKILQSALPDVAFDGWSDELIDKAASKLKVPAEEAHALFPKGALSLACYFSDWADEQMLERAVTRNWDKLKIREKIATGVCARLEALGPHKAVVSASLAYLALPPRNLHLPKMVWATADALWRAAGDTATDYNHYTKRLLLSGVLTSTTLYWLNDRSEGHENTWAFLSRRIENVLKLGQKLSSLKKARGERA